jgi:hypothetical protein
VVLALFAASMNAADPPDAKLVERVTRLVKQLGADDFEGRQNAEKQLIDLGPPVLPILDKLEPFADVEVAQRVRRIRRILGGAAEELRQAFEAELPNLKDDREGRWDLAPEMRELILESQPRAGDYLLSVIGNPKHPLHRLAVNAFVQTWDSMTAEQIRTYLQKSLITTFYGRTKLPREVDAMIGMGYQFRHGWGGRPASEKLNFVTRTIHSLDANQYGNPYRYPHASSGCTTGWVKTKDLSVGRHTISFVVEFEADHHGKKVTGSVRSDEFVFEMLPADTPDDLIAPKDAEVEKLVRKALRVVETEEELQDKRGGIVRFDKIAPKDVEQDWWRPQITWKEPDGKPNGLHVPVWRLESPLPVDLCFEVTIRVEGTKEEFKGYPLVKQKGTTQHLGYFCPRETAALVKGRSGYVPVRLILKPSRAVALTSTNVTSYYPSEIVTDVLRMKVGPPEEPRARK